MQGGETRTFGEQHKLRRNCLGGCGKQFNSEGPWNRICTKCELRNQKLSAREASNGISLQRNLVATMQGEHS